MNIDDVLPHWDHTMTQTRRIDAPIDAVWSTLDSLPMSALPLGRFLIRVRYAPTRLRGHHSPLRYDSTFLEQTPIPVVLRNRPHVILSAGLSQAWKPAFGTQPPKLAPDELRTWTEPGWIKVAMEFRLVPEQRGTCVSCQTRILATDPISRRLFSAYWRLVHPFAAAMRHEVLTAVARRLEHGVMSRR